MYERDRVFSKSIKEQKQPPKVFYKKRFLKNFAKFTGRYLCQSLFLNKVAGFRVLQSFEKVCAICEVRI